jgi:hypothetical protein
MEANKDALMANFQLGDCVEKWKMRHTPIHLVRACIEMMPLTANRSSIAF